MSEHKKKRTVTIDDYINVLGVDNFIFEPIEECSLEELDEREKFYIKKFNSNIDGYNLQKGGYNNSQGEGNGRALVTEDEVKFIRECYKNHLSQKEIYEEYFKNKITKNAFQSIWQGRSWKYIMPEVYTEKNKDFYKRCGKKSPSSLSLEDLLKYRQYYVDHPLKEVYELYISDHNGEKILKERTFQKIITGDVRSNSNYLKVPVYIKSQKKWKCID